LLETENAILKLIAGGQSAEAITARICREAEQRFPGMFCAVIGVDAAGLTHVLAGPSGQERFAAAIEKFKSKLAISPCGKAIRSRQPVFVADVARGSKKSRSSGEDQDVGFRAWWVCPILSESSEAVGLLVLCSPEPRLPTDEENAGIAVWRELCELTFRREGRVEDRTRQAHADALTGLPTRAAFEMALASQPRDVQGAWALFVVDLDNLKTVNDVFGHKAGDDLIRTAAQRIARAAAPNRTFRLGGDEFAVIVDHPASLRDLEAAAGEILKALDRPADCDGHCVTPNATIGGAVFLTSDGDAARVYKNADFALYHAKETGRGGFVRYWPGIASRMISRQCAIQDVAAALEEQRIEAHYQPVLRLDTREIVGVETLCRLRTPAGEIVPASLFKEATADAKVATALTSRMLAIVSSDIEVWSRRGIPFPSIALNVSAADFYTEDMLRKLEKTFRPLGMPLERVTLEISEDISTGRGDRVVPRQVERLRRHGVRVALDDFGSGRASLTHLLDMPVDEIKIARSLIARLWPDDPGMVIVQGLIDMAGHLDIRLVATGIETEVEASQLWTMGCTHGQGFELSRPVTSARMAELLRWSRLKIPRGIPLPRTRVA